MHIAAKAQSKSILRRKNAPAIAEALSNVGDDLSSQSVSRQVFSALVSLTSVFGMGTGGPSPLKTPTIFRHCTLKTKQRRIYCKDKTCISCRSSPRAISTDWLNALLHLHRRPINEVVYLGPYSQGWEILS